MFAASAILSINMQDNRVLNSVEAGRRLMLRAAVYPLVAVAVLALVLLLMAGPKAALGALASGVAVTAGGWFVARMGLDGRVRPAGSALLRLVLGMAAKLALLIVVLVVSILVFKLPGLALLAGIIIGLTFQALALARH